MFPSLYAGWPTTEAALDGLDEHVGAELGAWQVPGLSLAVIKDGGVAYTKGYGLRDVRRGLPVTDKTLFPIGSATKSFTAAALGMLVEEGRLEWDKPVRDYLPGLRLHDEVAAQRITPRDLVTHRSGLPRHDLLWYNSDATREELFGRLRHLEPSADFRSVFQYQNLMFMLAGHLCGHVAGTSWEEFTARRILAPLGMGSTNFSVLESQAGDDYALPYAKLEGEVKEIPFQVMDAIGPAGSINSTAEDMSRYLLFHLNQGRHGESQLLSLASVAQMQSPQVVVPDAPLHHELSHTTYGLGWFIIYYRGRKLVYHGGSIDGFLSVVSFMPREQVGVVVLANLGASLLTTSLTFNVYDRLLGLEPIAWSDLFHEEEKRKEQIAQELDRLRYVPRKPGTSPAHPLEEYAGEYEHPGYGPARVGLAEGGLHITYHGMTRPLTHYHYEVFMIPKDAADPFAEAKVTFNTDAAGGVGSISVPMEPAVREVVFTRAPERAVTEKGLLERLVGEYRIGAMTFAVALEGGDTLTIQGEGQPKVELTPAHGLCYELKGLPGFKVEFKEDDDGRVRGALVTQPNGVFAAERV